MQLSRLTGSTAKPTHLVQPIPIQAVSCLEVGALLRIFEFSSDSSSSLPSHPKFPSYPQRQTSCHLEIEVHVRAVPRGQEGKHHAEGSQPDGSQGIPTPKPTPGFSPGILSWWPAEVWKHLEQEHHILSTCHFSSKSLQTTGNLVQKYLKKRIQSNH